MKRSKRKTLGQHFLRNPRLIQKITQVINPSPGDVIIEIGAGQGSLTLALANHGSQVVAIEKDPHLAEFLQSIIPSNVTLIQGDFLRLDLQKEIVSKISPTSVVKVVGNLPYSVASPIIIKVFNHKSIFPFWVFLIQEEMANRFLASPGSKKIAPLAILLQNHFEIHRVLRIRPQSFSPPPRVYSSLLTFVKRSSPLFPIEKEKDFLAFLKKCFACRRKTLANNLRGANFPLETIKEGLTYLKIPPQARAEELELKTFYNLYTFFLSPTKSLNQKNKKRMEQ